MDKQSKHGLSGQILAASGLLFVGLLEFLFASGYDGPENKFLADNWGFPLIILLIVMFDLGWWYEKYSEHLALSKGRTVTAIAIISFVVVFILIAFGSLVFIPHGFWHYALVASACCLGSGFFYRYSV